MKRKISAAILGALLVVLFVACGSSGFKVVGGIDACTTDADCVPASCCHAAECISASKPKSACFVDCSTSCNPGTIDCGGGCLCQDGLCAARVLE